jgi:hypothetical protein
VAVTSVALVACGDDDNDDGEVVGGTTSPSIDTGSTAGLDGPLPPEEATALLALYGDALEDLGLELTPRGGLIDVSNGGYTQSPTGTHLALYVEPTGEYTPQQYVDGILAVTKVFAPDVFARWPGLESFDVCQEPPTEVDARPEPIPATQIELSRAQSAAIDWDTVTIADLVEAGSADPPGLRLVVSEQLQNDPAYAQAVAAG